MIHTKNGEETSKSGVKWRGGFILIEGVYFKNTDEGRYSGFNSMSEKKEKKIIEIIKKEKITVEVIPKKINEIRISKPEKVFDKITPDDIVFIGNNGFKIKTKNPKKKYRYPDFKVTGQNKVIEIFGIYYHDIFKGGPDSPRDLIREYKEVGYDCLVFWEYEIIKTYEKRKEYPKPDLDRVLRRTLEFIN